MNPTVGAAIAIDKLTAGNTWKILRSSLVGERHVHLHLMPRILLFIIAAASVAAADLTPVAQHGRLRTDGARIVGEDGEPVSLAGNSLFWSQWEGEWWNPDCIRWLKHDWKSTIIRAPLGIVPDGYLQHPDIERARLENVVDAAIAEGLYVIIDWHDHHAHRHEAQAIDFFQQMARKYGEKPNVVYEIYNEPETVSWTKQVKPYAEHVIAAIRAIDSDNLIVVGTPRWSQDVDFAAKDPINDVNVAYALHFYAGTHKRALRSKAEAALRSGVALVVTEWGSCDSNGRGKIDATSTAEWMEFMRAWKLTHCNWAVSDKDESASVLLPNASPQGNWQDEQLTESGKLARQWIRKWAMLFPNGAATPQESAPK
jgi:aryl-phospho-beta-D-glucosidase BglC (GH1 family)